MARDEPEGLGPGQSAQQGDAGGRGAAEGTESLLGITEHKQGKTDPGQVPQQVCRHLVEFLGVVDQHRIESRTAGLCDGGVGQEQACAMNQFGVVEGPVEIGDRQVGLEETPDRLEDRVSQGEFYDVFRVETELPGPGQHLTQLPGEGARPGCGTDLLRPGLLTLALEQVPEPLFLLRGPEQPEVLCRISQFPQQPQGEPVHGRHAGPDLGSPTSPDDVPPQFLGRLPGGRQDHEPLQRGALLQAPGRRSRQGRGLTGSRSPEHHPDSSPRHGCHRLPGIRHGYLGRDSGQQPPGSGVVHGSMEP